MNLVVGATGQLGGEICRRLAAGGAALRALTRSTSEPGKVVELRGLGVTPVRGDLREPATLDAACAGVKAVISTASATLSRQEGDSLETVDRDGQLSLVEAAERVGVEHFIFVSFRQKPDLHHALEDAKRSVEARLRSSGMIYTVLQASYFMEVWLSPALGFDFPNASARIYGEGKNRISWVSVKDVAAFAAASLESPAARNAIVEVGGPEAMGPLEVVAVFERIGGKPFKVEHVPVDALEARKASAGNSLEEAFAALMLTYARGDAIDMTATLKDFPLRLTSVEEYAKTVLGA